MDRPDRCLTCPIGGAAAASGAPASSGFFLPDGEMRSGVMVVAEALGSEEEKQAKALVGPSGFLMGRLWSRKRWDRDDYRYCTSIFCRPFRNTIRDERGRLYPWAEAALAHCAPHLDAQIDEWKPKAILAFGATALYRLTGEHHDILSARGYVFREKQNRTWVVPTLHPAYLMRGNNALGHVLLMDAEKARRIAREGFTYDEPLCHMDPPFEVWQGYVRRALAEIARGVPLAIDIETPRKGDEDEDTLEVGVLPDYELPDRVSVAVGLHEGVSVPWTMPYIVGVKALLNAAITSSVVLIWNAPFDAPRLEAALSMVIPVERIRDVMDRFHVLCNFSPRKLGFATSMLPSSWRLRMWKHLAHVDAPYYSVVDAIALWRNDYDVGRLLVATGQDGVYQRMMPDIDPALAYMGRQGMLVDVEARDRLEQDLVTILGDLGQTMNRVVPPDVRPLKVWKSAALAEKGMARLRAKGTDFAGPEPVPGTVKVRTCPVCGAYPVTKAHVARKYAKG